MSMRPTAETPSPEPAILRARVEGSLSANAAFEQLYALYASPVMAWLRLRVEGSDADDLFQDVWRIFYGRWGGWQHSAEMDAPGARPVLSFLYRTCHFVLQGHRRMARPAEPLDAADPPDGVRGPVYGERSEPEQMSREIELGPCLALARKICPAEELEVLMAKLAGVPAREIAQTFGISEPAVDHRFRDAVARLRRRLEPAQAKRTRRTHGQA